MGTVAGICGSRASSSGDRPEKEMRSIVSFCKPRLSQYLLLISICRFQCRPCMKLQPARKKTYRPHHPQVPMQSLGRMQEGAVNPQAIHRGLNLPSNLPALPNTTDNQLPALAHTARNAIHGPGKFLLRPRISLIQTLEMRKGRALGGHHMDGCYDGGDVFRCGRCRLVIRGAAGRSEGPLRHDGGV